MCLLCRIWLSSKESACNTGAASSIPGSGRSTTEGNGSPIRYSCLENPMDRGTWGAKVHEVAKSQTRLSTSIDVTCGSQQVSLPFCSVQFSRSVDFCPLSSPSLHEMFPWYLSFFLKRSLVFPILLFSSISLH